MWSKNVTILQRISSDLNRYLNCTLSLLRHPSFTRSDPRPPTPPILLAMNDDMRMQEDGDGPQDNRNNRNGRRSGMEIPDDEPALDGYAR